MIWLIHDFKGYQTISRKMVADRLSYCKEVFMVALDGAFENEGEIGGLGEVIEIDKCKIGRRKYKKKTSGEGFFA